MLVFCGIVEGRGRIECEQFELIGRTLNVGGQIGLSILLIRPKECSAYTNTHVVKVQEFEHGEHLAKL
jgi:hypothetical protein